MVFGGRKRGRGLALLGLALLVLAAAVAWWPVDSQVAAQAEKHPAPVAEQGPVVGLLGPAARAGWRKATPVTRGQDLGFRFRPDERAPAYGEVIAPGGGQAEPREQANFRPIGPRRKPTYEELQAREQAGEPTVRIPPAPYPALPPPPPPYPMMPW